MTREATPQPPLRSAPEATPQPPLRSAPGPAPGRTLQPARGLPRELQVVAERQGGVFTWRQALDSGVTESAVRHRVRSGTWVRVRPQVYAVGAPADPTQRLIRLCRAAQLVAPGAVISHLTAAQLWQLELSGLERTAPTIAQPLPIHVSHPRRPAARLAGIRLHRCPVATEDVDRPHGVPATSLARTVVDCARVLPFREAVVVADSALRSDPTVAAELHRVARATRGWPGSGPVGGVLSFADPRAESVLESLARVLWHTHGLPPPRSQAVLLDRGRFLARVDFLWERARLVVEVDGMAKYADPATDPHERERRHRLEDAGYRVRTFTWADVVYAGPRTVARVARELGR